MMTLKKKQQWAEFITSKSDLTIDYVLSLCGYSIDYAYRELRANRPLDKTKLVVNTMVNIHTMRAFLKKKGYNTNGLDNATIRDFYIQAGGHKGMVPRATSKERHRRISNKKILLAAGMNKRDIEQLRWSELETLANKRRELLEDAEIIIEEPAKAWDILPLDHIVGNALVGSQILLYTTHIKTEAKTTWFIREFPNTLMRAVSITIEKVSCDDRIFYIHFKDNGFEFKTKIN